MKRVRHITEPPRYIRYRKNGRWLSRVIPDKLEKFPRIVRNDIAVQCIPAAENPERALQIEAYPTGDEWVILGHFLRETDPRVPRNVWVEVDRHLELGARRGAFWLDGVQWRWHVLKLNKREQAELREFRREFLKMRKRLCRVKP